MNRKGARTVPCGAPVLQIIVSDTQVLCVVRKAYIPSSMSSMSFMFKHFYLLFFYVQSMLCSVYEEPGDAGVVAIDYCRSCLITQYFWLGGLDSRSAVR